ncbi:DotH/IcmK family type IV secretion protein [Cysteiniphilum marinum]|uniref:DotH/IcmK family type IV secretion protein n=1 Tax=Cysteiniphilum marinum TaxID=2774191 RepID=UPI0019393666|nr:DotH/IcmK family type IV secretion protein [Cysteiniphilum marinum]
MAIKKIIVTALLVALAGLSIAANALESNNQRQFAVGHDRLDQADYVADNGENKQVEQVEQEKDKEKEQLEKATYQAQYEAFKKAEQDKYYAYLMAAEHELNPTQIKALNKVKYEIESAKFQTKPLKRIRQTIIYSEDMPPVLYIGRSQLSTISFVDRAGNPYPIQSYEVSDSNAFNVSQRATGSLNIASLTNTKSAQDQSSRYAQFTQSQDTSSHQKDDKSLPAYMLNSLTVRGQADFANGSLVIYLIGKANPVYLVLESSSEKYNYQSDITVDGLTAASLAETSITGVSYDRPSDDLMMFLNGTPPKKAERFEVSLANSDVWKLGDYFYLRTQNELMSPAYVTKAKTATGFSVYKILATTHIINVADHGRYKTASITEPMHLFSDQEIKDKYGAFESENDMNINNSNRVEKENMARGEA